MATMTEDYRAMVRIRKFEEHLAALKVAGEIPGSIHLCNGQEAIAVGVTRLMEERDYLTATYRGHGWAIGRGVAIEQIYAELMGRRSSLAGGRAGSPYFSDASVNFLGENSIVGAGVPIAAGAALSASRAGGGAVSVVSIGDGATNQGAVHEALNLAAVLTLPLVIVIENNAFSEMSRIEDMVKVPNLATRGVAYGIPAMNIDGNDVTTVTDAVATAFARARAGGGPTIIEAMTGRLQGHYSGDTQHYRDKLDLAAAFADEPLVRLRNRAEGQVELLREFASIDDAVDKELEGAILAAREIAFPNASEVFTHVYA